MRLDKFDSFISRYSTTDNQKWRNTAITFLLTFIWVFVVKHLFIYVWGQMGILDLTPPAVDTIPANGWTKGYTFATTCIITPLIEEMKFRVAPMVIARALGKKTIIPIMLASSIWFGEAHQNGYYSYMIQGMFGFFWMVNYVKNNYSYTHNVFLHSVWNATALYF